MSDESTEEPNSTSKWGYGKTDPDTWWPKGCPSPNKKGRPKGSKNHRTRYREAFAAKVLVKVDGKPIKLTKDELSYQNFANRCASGDLKAMALKLPYDEKYADPEPVEPPKEQTALNLKVLDHYIELRKQFGPSDTDAPDE
jgi:uncharacterized protein DUF5681